MDKRTWDATDAAGEALRERIKEELAALAELDVEARATRLAALQAEAPALAAELAGLLAHLDGEAPLPQSLIRVLPASRPSVLGPWRLEGEVGRGGTGVVYHAQRIDGTFKGQAAVKLLPPLLAGGSHRARFLRECQALARLAHPRIARLLDAGVSDDGFAYIVMEYVDGVPIDEWCRQQALDVPAIVQVMLSLCGGVAYMHAQLVVHRDLKPSNILIDRDGRPKLLDFGVARLLDEADGVTLGMAALTPAFASPEQIAGKAIGTTSDVFALGTLLYLLLAQRHPFAGPGAPPLAVMRAIAGSDPAPLPRERVPPDLAAIVLRALDKQPDRRYASADAFADDLRRFLDGEPVQARPASALDRTGKWLRRNRVVATVSLVALVTVTGFAVRAEFAARAERKEADLAERRLEQVRQFAHAIIFDYDNELARLPGTLELRRKLVGDALGYLDALSAEAGARPDLMLETAEGYEHIGGLQGQGWYGANLGDPNSADASLAKAEALRRALLLQQDDAEARFKLAAVVEQRSDVALAMGRVADAMRGVSEAEQLFASAATAQGLERAARLAIKQGDLAERGRGPALRASLDHYERHLALIERARAAGAQFVPEQELAYNRFSITLPLMRLGYSGRAVAAATESLKQHEALLSKVPGVDTELGLAISRMRLAEAETLHGMLRDGQEQAAQAVRAIEAIVASDAKNAAARLRAMRAQLALGRAALANGDGEAALQAARAIMAHAGQLPPPLRAGLGGHLVAHGQRVLAQALDANDPSAVALLKEACATFDAAVKSGSGGERTRLDVAGCQLELALAARQRGQVEVARAALEQAIAVRSDWQRESPDDAENIAELARAETALATLGDGNAGNIARALVTDLESSDRLSPLWRMQISRLQDPQARPAVVPGKTKS